MDFFQKIGNVANKTCKYTTDQTNKLKTVTKLKWKMNECKSKINDLYEELGKLVYENNVREYMEDYQERIDEKCTQIDDLASKVEKCRTEILKLNHKKQCQNCYTEIDNDANYCTNCGAAQEHVEKQNDENKDYNKEAKEVEIIEENEVIDTNEKIDLDSYVDVDKIKNNYSKEEEITEDIDEEEDNYEES